MTSIIWKSNSPLIKFDPSLNGIIFKENLTLPSVSWCLSFFSEPDLGGFSSCIQLPYTPPFGSSETRMQALPPGSYWMNGVQSWAISWCVDQPSEFIPAVVVEKRFPVYLPDEEVSPATVSFISLEISGSNGVLRSFSPDILYYIGGNFNEPIDFTNPNESVEFKIYEM